MKAAVVVVVLYSYGRKVVTEIKGLMLIEIKEEIQNQHQSKSKLSKNSESSE